MDFLYAIYNFMKYGVRSLFARAQSLKSTFSPFICGIFATSLEINVSQHILSNRRNQYVCISYFFHVFRVFLELMKKGVRYLVAMTPSFMTEASVLGRAGTSHQLVHPILQQNFGTNVLNEIFS